MLSAAIPQFVSLLLMRTMLKDNGLINNLLVQAGLISSPLPFLTNATWARATVVIINLWVGIPFTMMQVTGILQNIPGELYEAARVDEAAGVDFEGDKAKAVTDYLVDLVNNPNFVSDADGSGLSGLRDGSVKAMFSGSWDASAVKEALGDNYGVVQLPTITINGEEKQMKSFSGSKAIGVNLRRLQLLLQDISEAQTPRKHTMN